MDKNILELMKIIDAHQREINAIVLTMDKMSKLIEKQQSEIDMLILSGKK